VVTIEQLAVADPPGSPAPVAADEITYEGKTFAQWLRLMQTERKEDMIRDAMLALVALAEGNQARPVVRAILDEALRHGDVRLDKGWPKAPLHTVMRDAVHFLQQLDSPEGAAALAEELDGPDPQRRMYALYALKREHCYIQDGGTTYYRGTISLHHARTAFPAVLRVTHDPEPRIRQLAMQVAVELAPQQDEVRQRLQEALDDADDSVFTFAALQLAELDPGAERLPAALARIMHNASLPLDVRSVAAAHVATIAPKTEGLTEFLVGILTPPKDPGIDPPAAMIQRRAIKALGDLGPGAASEAPTLLYFIQGEDLLDKALSSEPLSDTPDRNKSISRLAVEAIGAMGPAAASPEVTAALTELLEFIRNTLPHTDEFQEEKLTALKFATTEALAKIREYRRK
jgi:hypothetical protein